MGGGARVVCKDRLRLLLLLLLMLLLHPSGGGGGWKQRLGLRRKQCRGQGLSRSKPVLQGGRVAVAFIVRLQGGLLWLLRLLLWLGGHHR